MNWEFGGEPEALWRKPAPGSLCPSQILDHLTFNRTRTVVVGNQRLTVWAMARSISLLYFLRHCRYWLGKGASCTRNKQCGELNVERKLLISFQNILNAVQIPVIILQCECSEFNFHNWQPHFWLWYSWFDCSSVSIPGTFWLKTIYDTSPNTRLINQRANRNLLENPFLLNKIISSFCNTHISTSNAISVLS
jgi:hypothetical protein